MHRRAGAGMLAWTVALGPAAAAAYPGGTPYFVTDVAPYCASCHSSTSRAQFDGIPEQRVQAELAEAKHLAEIRAAKNGSPYAKLGADQKAALLRDIARIDAAARVRVAAPSTVKSGASFEVTVSATGGGGPVVGIALVDAAHRWQARPATSAGWQVLETPRVIGPNGRPQSRFTDARNPALAPGVTYVNVYDVTSAPEQERYSTVSVTYRLRAPGVAGSYPLAAAFLYGTEKGSANGAVETVQGKQPLGGFGGHSGRVQFSEVLSIRVE